jgi:hypothetical protein
LLFLLCSANLITTNVGYESWIITCGCFLTRCALSHYYLCFWLCLPSLLWDTH